MFLIKKINFYLKISLVKQLDLVLLDSEILIRSQKRPQKKIDPPNPHLYLFIFVNKEIGMKYGGSDGRDGGGD